MEDAAAVAEGKKKKKSSSSKEEKSSSKHRKRGKDEESDAAAGGDESKGANRGSGAAALAGGGSGESPLVKVTQALSAIYVKAQHNPVFRQRLQLYALIASSVIIMLMFVMNDSSGDVVSARSSVAISSSKGGGKGAASHVNLASGSNAVSKSSKLRGGGGEDGGEDGEEGGGGDEDEDGGDVVGVDGDFSAEVNFGRPKREVEIEDGDDEKIKGSDLLSIRRRYGTRQENEKAQQSEGGRVGAKDELCFKFPPQIKRTPGEPYTYYTPRKVFDLPVLQRQLKKLGWEQETDLKKATLALKGVPRITFRQLKSGKTYYDMVASLGRIGSKKKTQLATLRAHVKKFGCSFESLHIQPRSWDMSRPSECKNFFETHPQDKGRMIVFKSCNPGEGSKGAGIIVADNIKEYRQKYSECEQSAFNYVAQYYIEHPLLLNNKKFDMRCYLFVASTKPYVVFFNPGYVRRSLADYKPTSTAKNDVLTNYHVQMTRTDFSPAEAMWEFPKLIEYLRSQNLCKACGDIEIRLSKIARLVFDSGRQYYVRHPGSFQIVGLDFMMDANLRPMFIEGNVSPGLGSHELKWKKDLMDDLVTMMYQTTTQIVERPDEFKMMIGDRMYGPKNNYWELIVHEQHEQCDKKYALDPCKDLKPNPRGW